MSFAAARDGGCLSLLFWLFLNFECDVSPFVVFVVLVDERHSQNDIPAHRTAQDLDVKWLHDLRGLSALNGDGVPIDVREGLVEYRFVEVGAQTYVLDQALPLLVVLGHDVFVLLIVDCPVLFVEEDPMLHDEHVLHDGPSSFAF